MKYIKNIMCSLALPIGMLLLFMGFALLIQGSFGDEFIIKEIMVGFFTAMVGIVMLTASLNYAFNIKSANNLEDSQ